MTERSVLRMIFTNLRNAFKILPTKGKLVGEDHLGNTYYQAPKNEYSHRKSPARWFVPREESDWQQDLPAEWEAWLRGRRTDVPTKEEVLRNLAIADMKKIKGAELEAKYHGKPESDSKLNSKGFPILKGYQKDPKSSPDKP